METVGVVLTKTQVTLLLEAVTGINWPGKLLETGVELKGVLAKSLAAFATEEMKVADPQP